MVCSKNICINSIVYFEKNEFNYNVRKNKNKYVCMVVNYMEKKDILIICLWVVFKFIK